MHLFILCVCACVCVCKRVGMCMLGCIVGFFHHVGSGNELRLSGLAACIFIHQASHHTPASLSNVATKNFKMELES